MDPFALTAAPAAYVPRPACEEALAELERLVRGGPIVALSGPPGIGKTMLLRVLERRLAGSLRSVYVPYGALEFRELCALVLGLQERPHAAGADPAAELAAEARRSAARGEPLLLLLDDANAIPLATLRALVDLAHSLGGALRLLAVPVDEARAARVLAALGPDAHHVRLALPMTADETAHYVAGRLALSSARDPALASLTPAQVSWLHRESAGIPRRRHQLVAWILHRDTPAPDSIAPFSEAGPWLELDAG